jgi:alkyldihydroxyacetonephosphate synthase
MLGPAIEAALKPHGLTLRHYPQSFEFSTLGGWIATRAGGHFATLYTHIDDLVAATRMITPAGVFATGPLPGDGAGPAPDRLVAGSEGAFGVITEAWMRVHPRPRFRARASVHFDDFTRACAAARALAGSGLYPTNCRLLEAAEAALNLVADDGSHVLIVGFESADHPLEPWLARALELCADHGGTCPRGPWFKAGDDGGGGAGAEAAWRQAFVDAPYLMNTMVSLGVLVETCETACSWRAFPALDAAVRDAAREVMDRVCGGGRITCRFTHVYPDGPAPYYTLLAPARRGAEREQWRAVKTAVCDAMLATGGTITHHHAVGRTFRPWYERQRPPAVRAALAAVKASLDPAGIMNPGVLLETGGGP